MNWPEFSSLNLTPRLEKSVSSPQTMIETNKLMLVSSLILRLGSTDMFSLAGDQLINAFGTSWTENMELCSFKFITIKSLS